MGINSGIQSFMLIDRLMPSVLPLATAQEDLSLASVRARNRLTSLGAKALRSPANLVHRYKPLRKLRQ